MFKNLLLILFCAALFFSCAQAVNDQTPDQKKADAVLDKEVGKMMDLYAKAITTKDPALIGEFSNLLKEFDSKYKSSLADDFNKKAASVRLTGTGNWDPLTDLPLNTDGAVYLSGGNDGAVSTIISFVSPKATPGELYHGASLDINKFDPTNLETQCFQTAIVKGAGYETADEWMRKPNVSVFNPAVSINSDSLNTAQSSLDYYCSPSNTNMQYGFFKNYANIFSIVTKSDNYYWYCTKVVWRIYSQLGIDLDSNTSKIDWTTSGLYSMVKAYYYTIYFYSPSTAAKKIKEYINSAKSNLVLAEEIYFSPYLTKVYETVRD